MIKTMCKQVKTLQKQVKNEDKNEVELDHYYLLQKLLNHMVQIMLIMYKIPMNGNKLGERK